MTKLLTLALCMFSSFAVAAQPEPGPWKVDIGTGLGLTQASYSDNWTGGEAGTLNWNSFFNGTANRQLSANWFWGNDLKLAFGQTHRQDKITKEWDKPAKSEDKIRFDGIGKLTKGWFVDPYVAASAESQFLDDSGLKKRYVNPLELTESTGLSRYIVNNPSVNETTTRIGAGFRQRFTMMDNGTGGDTSVTVYDGGAEWVTDMKLGSAASKYTYVSKLTLFQALFNSESDSLNDDWKEVDLNWDNSFRAKVSSVIQVGLTWQLLYDKEISTAGRFKQTLSLGIAYTFANYKKEE